MTREDAIKYLRQIYPNGGHCWLDDQRIEALDMAIQALSVSLPKGWTCSIPEGDVVSLKSAAQSLVDAVEKYTRQECLRSELMIKKDKLKELLK